MNEARVIRNPNKVSPSVPSQQHLYHGTQMSHLGLIIKSNSLDEGVHWGKPGEPHGVRCTRSLEAAKLFAFDQEFPGGILVLNWPRLAQRYKIISYQDTQEDGESWNTDEAEEVILTAGIKPLSAFLEGILMQPQELQELRSGEFLKDEWTDGYAAYDGRPLYVHRRGIQALMDYPNIKVIG